MTNNVSIQKKKVWKGKEKNDRKNNLSVASNKQKSANMNGAEDVTQQKCEVACSTGTCSCDELTRKQGRGAHLAYKQET